MERFLQGCRAALQVFLEKGVLPPTLTVYHELQWAALRIIVSHACKSEQSDQESLGVHIVLGNEACDLDSMVSAIALAYFLAKMQVSSETKLAFVPVLNIPRADFPLRTEGTFFLRKNGIQDEHLIFRDEVDLLSLHEVGLLSITLVDHNVLPRSDEALEEAVTEVIDHHALERKASPGCKVSLEPVGSCTTLVAEKIFQEAPQLLDAQLASMLHGTIVLDCVNMAPAAGKVTPKDTEYVTLLESRFPEMPPRDVIFDLLQKAKFDVTGLTTEQMLRKDLKALNSQDISLSISAIYVTLEVFLQRPNVQKELCTFCRAHKYNVWVGMAIAFNDLNEPQRQLAVYSQDRHLRELVCRVLEQAEDPNLRLSPLHSPSPDITAYEQGNTTASRKKVLPILKTFLREREQRGARTATADCTARWGPDTPWGCGECWPVQEGLEDDHLGDSSEASLQDGLRCKEYLSGSRTHVDDTLMEDDFAMPPTPMNSLVEGCPLDRGLPKLTAEALMEKFCQFTVANSDSNSGTQ